jgi:hypothetical protein
MNKHMVARLGFSVLLCSACAGQSRRTGPPVIDGVVDSLVIHNASPGSICSVDCGDGFSVLRADGVIDHWPGLMGLYRRGKPERTWASPDLLARIWKEAVDSGFPGLAARARAKPCRVNWSHYSLSEITFYIDTAQVGIEHYWDRIFEDSVGCGFPPTDSMEVNRRDTELRRFFRSVARLSAGNLP